MNRFLALAVVALMAVGATGCATGVEDPQPPPPTPTKSNPPPAQPFSSDVDTKAPDPNEIAGSLNAPKPDLEAVQPPVPVNGIDTNQESNSLLDPNKLIAPIPVNE